MADDSRVSAVTNSEGHAQGHANGGCLAAGDDGPTLTGGGIEELSVTNDVMNDVERHGRRRHRGARRKSRRHHHQRHQQTLVADSSTISTGHQSTAIMTSSLAALSSS